ncbi:MAG: hypothetical protein WDW36_002864 [Sanguina aurantia]
MHAAPASPALVKIAVAQMTSVNNSDVNFQTCASLVKAACEAGAAMLFLPECHSFIGATASESLGQAQQLNGPLMTAYQELARSNALWLSLGGFQEVGPDPAHLYNTHVIIDSDGELVSRYRKIHLFDVDIPNGPVLMESNTTAPGDEAVVCDSIAGRIGVTVCYDLRFPELYQTLTWGMGATLIAVPSAFTKMTGEAHWEILLRARAIECQAYVVAAAQAGRHSERRESFGNALIIDPWGKIVARLEDPLATGIATADIDMSLLQQIRAKMPIATHRLRGQTAYVSKVVDKNT